MTDEEIVAQLRLESSRHVFDILSWKTQCLTRWRSAHKKCDASLSVCVSVSQKLSPISSHKAVYGIKS
jgi:hypothetical protein